MSWGPSGPPGSGRPVDTAAEFETLATAELARLVRAERVMLRVRAPGRAAGPSLVEPAYRYALEALERSADRTPV